MNSSSEPTGSSRTEFNKVRLVAWAYLTYVVTVGIFLLAWNAVGGGMVQNWYEEHVGPDGSVMGSGEWRSHEGQAFANVGLLFGTWIYPLSVIAAVVFIGEALNERRISHRVTYLTCAALAACVLFLFLKLGFFRAVSQF